MKYKLTTEEFNQDVITITGITLYEYDKWLTDGQMVVNKYTVNVENCTIKPLEEDMFKKHIEPLITFENLKKIIADKNEIEDIYEREYIGNNIYKTKSKYVIIGSDYHTIFREEECTIVFYKDDKFYFFLPLCDVDGTENDELMFVGVVMACQATLQKVKNALAVNEFLDSLPPMPREMFATEFDIKTFNPSGTITKPRTF